MTSSSRQKQKKNYCSFWEFRVTTTWSSTEWMSVSARHRQNDTVVRLNLSHPHHHQRNNPPPALHRRHDGLILDDGAAALGVMSTAQDLRAGPWHGARCPFLCSWVWSRRGRLLLPSRLSGENAQLLIEEIPQKNKILATSYTRLLKAIVTKLPKMPRWTVQEMLCIHYFRKPVHMHCLGFYRRR